MAAKPTWEEYLDWVKNKFEKDFVKGAFDRDVMAVKGFFLDSRFWATLPQMIADATKAYTEETNSQLFTSLEFQPPDLLVKEFRSALDKTFRLNVHWNENWPEAPENGWVTPENLLQSLNDSVRTTVVARYLDGPRFLAEAFSTHAEAHDLIARIIHPRSVERQNRQFAVA